MNCTPGHPHLRQQVATGTLKRCLATTYLLLASCCLSACQTPSQTASPDALANDLSIEFFIEGSTTSSNPLLHRSRYVLEPDRSLHIDVSPSAQNLTYPPFAVYFTPQQMRDVARVVHEGHLLTAQPPKADPNQPPASLAADEPVYHVTLTGNGQTRRWVATAAQQPVLLKLLKRLVLAGRVHAVTAPSQTVEVDTPAPEESP